MNLTKKRWVMLVLCCVINLCLGSIYAWSVFASPMAEYLSKVSNVSYNSGDLSIVYTIANAVAPITMISGGVINDKFGPRKVIFIGGLMFGFGLFSSGFVKSIGGLIITYGLIYGLGLGLAYGCTISSCVKFFPDKRGLIGGVTTAVYGLSSVILPPIINAIVAVSGVTAAFRVVGIVFVIAICISAMFLIPCPENFSPQGWNPSAAVSERSGIDMTWKEMLIQPIFYVMILMLTCGTFSGMMIISQASAVAANMVGMSIGMAGIAVSVLAMFNALGRIAAGLLSDRIGRIHTLSLAFAVSVVGLIALYFCGTGTIARFYLGVSIVGICYGAFMGVYPGFTADQFGARNNSVNYGFMFIGLATAGFFGPSVMSRVYSSDHMYQRAFIYALGFQLLGLILSFIYRALKRNKIKVTI